MKKLLAIFLITALSAGLLAGCGSKDSAKESTTESETESDDKLSLETDSNGKVYTHEFDSETNQVIDFYEIEFQIPEDWTEVGDSDGTVYNSSDGTLSISSNEKTGSDPDLTSEEEQEKIISSVDSGDSFVETGHKTMTILDDVTALYFTCSQNISDTPVDMYVIAFYTTDRNYMFGYADRQSADFNHSKDFDQIIASFTWAPGYEEEEEAVEAEDTEDIAEAKEEESVDNTETQEVEEEPAQAAEESEPTASAGESNALQAAKKYLKSSHFSYSGLIDQLKFEGYTDEEAAYGVDNCGADWNEQALLKGQDYLNVSAYSRDGLINQLEFEGFSEGEATNAADNCGADWNEQAALKAQEYLNIMSYSKEDLINQLEFEGFTADQAAYGASSVMG